MKRKKTGDKKKEWKLQIGSSKKSQKKKWKLQIGSSIKSQLLIGFAIPIIFVILVGKISYEKAERGMAANYEEGTKSTIQTEMQYLDFGFTLIGADAIQIKLDTDLQSLAGGTYKNDFSKQSSVYNKTMSGINVKQTANPLIHAIYIVPKSDNKLMTTVKASNKQQKGFYEEWAATEEGQEMVSEKNKTNWVGSHPEMDKLTGYSQEDYMLSYVMPFSNKSAVLVIDISKKAVEASLKTLKIGEDFILGYITPDKRELLVSQGKTPKISSFIDQKFFKDCVANEETFGSKYVSCDGKKYFFIYAKSEKSGSILTALVPREVIIKSADSIKKITLFLVIIACITALMIGAFISLNIGTSMNRIIKKLKKVSEGDLTVQIKAKGKDEFSVLSRHIMETVSNTRKLIQEADDIMRLLLDAAKEVEMVSVEMETSSHGILETLVEMDSGVMQQADDTQDCFMQTDRLSQKIQSIGEDVGEAEKNSGITKEIVARSIQTMEELSNQSIATTEITERVKVEVRELEKKSQVIGGFVDVINEIAGQTKLLSLNASIEASRAGQAGRGFTVVAEEIGKLSAGTLNAAKEINKMVNEITKQTQETVVTVNQAETIVGDQADTVLKTKEDFANMNGCTEKLVAGIQKIAEKLDSIEETRIGTLEAISSISAISEETSSSSSGVQQIAQGQMNIVTSLRKASDDLKRKTNELEGALSLFKIEE
ncbi:MAG: methyl-accepting chemotaxis protein [Acetivibrio sp.]